MNSRKQVLLDFGRGQIPLVLPDGAIPCVIRKPEIPLLEDPDLAVAEALRRPVAARPLEEQARGCSSACIVICDITRPVPNGRILPPLVRALLRAEPPSSPWPVRGGRGRAGKANYYQ